MIKTEYYFKNKEFLKDLNYDNTYDVLYNLNNYIDSVTNKKIIGKNCNIGEDVVIEDHVIIKDNVTINAHAYIRAYSIIGEDCVIGHSSEVKHTIMFPGSKIGSLCFVGDSIIGEKSRIGSGTIISNRRFDQGEVGVKIDGTYYHLKSNFFGVILGDCSRIGAKCVTYPGTHIGSYSWIYPLNRVKGFIKNNVSVDNDKIIDLENHELI